MQSKPQLDSIYNVSKKIRAYLEEHQTTILKLSQTITDIKYLTLKRIAEFNDTDSLPNFSSLISLANFFQCTVNELLSKNVLLNTSLYKSLKDYQTNKNKENITVQINIDEYIKYKKPVKLFAIQLYSSIDFKKNVQEFFELPHENYKSAHVYIEVDSFEYEGYYLLEINNVIQLMNIVGIGTTFLLIENKEIISKIDLTTVKFLAKLIGYRIIFNKQHDILIGYGE